MMSHQITMWSSKEYSFKQINIKNIPTNLKVIFIEVLTIKAIFYDLIMCLLLINVDK